MGLPRSTYYDAPSRKADDAEIIATMMAICDEFEVYGYRRVGAELRHRDIIVNSKKVRRLMREHDLQPKRRRRFMATTDSDHDNPIFPDLARDRVVDGPNQLWVADITYIAIAAGFVYLAAILDAWSRRVVGYAISRSIDARLAIAALKAAIRARQPPRGCIHHSDRGSQYACLSQAARQPWVHRLDGSAREPLRQCQGRELHEDAEGRGRLFDGLRNVRGCHRRSSPLHRRGLQHTQTTLSARLLEPRAIRGPPSSANGQNCRLILSSPWGALHYEWEFDIDEVVALLPVRKGKKGANWEIHATIEMERLGRKSALDMHNSRQLRDHLKDVLEQEINFVPKDPKALTAVMTAFLRGDELSG